MTKVAASKEGVQLFLSLVFILINSADPYEIPPYAASPLLHSFDNVSVEGFSVKKMVDKGSPILFQDDAADPYGIDETISIPLYYSADRDRIITRMNVPCGGGKSLWIQCGAALFLKGH